jgi:hypothetical protein
MKLLIDECLSEELAKMARRRGHATASHIAWIGKRSWKDWKLIPEIVEGSWTFVTKNSVDFRGPARARGTKGLFARLDLHAGLVCLNGPVGMDLGMQLALFAAALDAIDDFPDLINRALEITLEEADGEIHTILYDLPPR